MKPARLKPSMPEILAAANPRKGTPLALDIRIPEMTIGFEFEKDRPLVDLMRFHRVMVIGLEDFDALSTAINKRSVTSAAVLEALVNLLKVDGRHMGACDPDCPHSEAHQAARVAIENAREKIQ